MASDPFPGRQLDDSAVAEYRDFYTELIGFVPPRIQARTDLLSRLDPELLRMQEEMRARAMYPDCFDVKTSQLMLFGILLGLLSDATRLHAIAARRAGATWEEMSAVVNLAFLFRGLPAANLGAQIIQEIAKSEATSNEQRVIRREATSPLIAHCSLLVAKGAPVWNRSATSPTSGISNC